MSGKRGRRHQPRYRSAATSTAMVGVSWRRAIQVERKRRYRLRQHPDQAAVGEVRGEHSPPPAWAARCAFVHDRSMASLPTLAACSTPMCRRTGSRVAGTWRWMEDCSFEARARIVRRNALEWSYWTVEPLKMSRARCRSRRSNGWCPGRYLRARRKEGFISVIAGFSFLGIMLGVATLIIVMAVMNGFRKELIDKILGMNGHLGGATDRGAADRLRRTSPSASSRCPGVTAVPFRVVDGPGAGHRRAHNAVGRASFAAFARDDLDKLASIAGNIQQGIARRHSTQGQGVAIGRRLADQLRVQRRRHASRWSRPRGAVTPIGHRAAHRSPTRSRRSSSIGMSEYDTVDGLSCRSPRRRPISTAPTTVERDRDLHRCQAGPGRRFPQAGGRRRRAAACSSSTGGGATSAFFAALQVERNVMFLILTLIVLVAALNIVSGLIMLVKDKGRDIAILRTDGRHRAARSCGCS